MKIHKQKETICYDIDGIKVYIKIDYFNNRIDIVEPIDIINGKFKKKEYCFIGRGVEFMNGWLNILEAMKMAIKDAKAKYEANLAEESKFTQEIIVKVEKELRRAKLK